MPKPKNEQDREGRIDRYVKDYSVRTLAEMLVELEDLYAPHAARSFARASKKRRKEFAR